MEGCPRIPLAVISPFTAEPCDFTEALEILITRYYELDFSSFAKPVFTLNELRRNALSTTNSPALVKQYLCQLNFLRGRFKQENVNSETFPLEFVWTNPVSKQQFASSEIEFEMAVIFYNIGCLYSSLGAQEERTTADSLKVACTHYLCAAWCFQAIVELIGIGNSPVPGDALQIIQTLMLAQAQQCILEKSFLDHRNSVAVAKIAVQISEYYAQCDRLTNQLTGSKLYSSSCNQVLRQSRLQFLQNYYEAISVIERGRAANDSQRYGEGLCLFQAAVAKLERCNKSLDRDWGYKDALAFTFDVAQGLCQAAARDNEHIYHERVPNFESLEQVKGACLVKAISFDLTDPELAGPDLFASLVPLSVTTSSSVYSEEKAKLLRDVTSQIEVKSKELDDFLSAVTPDLAVFDSTSLDNLPPELIELCASLSVDKTVAHKLVDLMKQLASMASDFSDMVGEISAIIESIATAGSASGISEPNLANAASFNEPLTRLKTAHEMATVSNTELHRAMTLQRDYFELMSKPIEEVRRALPSVQAAVDACDRTVVDRLRYVVGKVEEMRQQRGQLETQLRQLMASDDITSKVVAVSSEPNKVQELFKKEIAKFEPVVELITQNLGAQPNILSALTDANANFAELRSSVNIMTERRQAHVKVLLDSLKTAEELLAKANKGVGFYKKLNSLAEVLLSDVRKLHDQCKEEQAKKAQEEKAALEQKQKLAAAKTSRNFDDISMDDIGAVADVGDLPDLTATEGVTLKDLLPFLKPKSFGGNSRAERRAARQGASQLGGASYPNPTQWTHPPNAALQGGALTSFPQGGAGGYVSPSVVGLHNQNVAQSQLNQNSSFPQTTTQQQTRVSPVPNYGPQPPSSQPQQYMYQQGPPSVNRVINQGPFQPQSSQISYSQGQQVASFHTQQFQQTSQGQVNVPPQQQQNFQGNFMPQTPQVQNQPPPPAPNQFQLGYQQNQGFQAPSQNQNGFAQAQQQNPPVSQGFVNTGGYGQVQNQNQGWNQPGIQVQPSYSQVQGGFMQNSQVPASGYQVQASGSQSQPAQLQQNFQQNQSAQYVHHSIPTQVHPGQVYQVQGPNQAQNQPQNFQPGPASQYAPVQGQQGMTNQVPGTSLPNGQGYHQVQVSGAQNYQQQNYQAAQYVPQGQQTMANRAPTPSLPNNQLPSGQVYQNQQQQQNFPVAPPTQYFPPTPVQPGHQTLANQAVGPSLPNNNNNNNGGQVPVSQRYQMQGGTPNFQQPGPTQYQGGQQAVPNRTSTPNFNQSPYMGTGRSSVPGNVQTPQNGAPNYMVPSQPTQQNNVPAASLNAFVQQVRPPQRDLLDEPIAADAPIPPPILAFSQQTKQQPPEDPSPVTETGAIKPQAPPQSSPASVQAPVQAVAPISQPTTTSAVKNVAMVQPYNTSTSNKNKPPNSSQQERPAVVETQLPAPTTNSCKNSPSFESEWKWLRVRGNENLVQHLRNEASRLDTLIGALDQSPIYLDRDLKILVEHQERECARLTCSVSKCSPVSQNLSMDCLPYDFNRIRLTPNRPAKPVLIAGSPPPPSRHSNNESPDDDYINASRIDFGLDPAHVPRFIATQGPTANTLAKFWQMVWQENVETIVTLLDGDAFASFGLVQFWPAHQSTPLRWGDFEIQLKTVKDQAAGWRERILSVTCLTPPRMTRTLLQLHLRTWPSVKQPSLVVEFVHAVRYAWALQRNRQLHNVLVHCSNGSGWTGVFLATFWLLSEIDMAVKNDENIWSPSSLSSLSPFDLLCYVRRLRSQRRGCVQERQQLRHLYDVFSTSLHHVVGDAAIETSHVTEISKPPAAATGTDSVTAELVAATATISDIEHLLSGLTFLTSPPKKAQEPVQVEVVPETTNTSTALHVVVTKSPQAKPSVMNLSASPIASVLEDPNLFSMDDPKDSDDDGKKNKQKITKASFIKRLSDLGQDPLPSVIPNSGDDDPLGGLDPMWKLRNNQKPQAT